MANLKEIRNRITSVNSTMQITSAMKMVSAAKLKRAQDAITQMRPYAEKVQEILNNLSSSLEENSNEYTQDRKKSKVLVVGITSNRGLCGGFNNNITKKIKNIALDYNDCNFTVYPIGKKILDAIKHSDFINKDEELYKNAENIWNDLTFSKVSEIATSLMKAYKDERYDKIIIVYNSFKNAAVQVVKNEQFLPIITTTEDKDTSNNTDYVFDPSKKEIIEDLIPNSLKIQLYKAILDSHASEHGARMTAMHQATDNATELKKELQLTYNKARQAAITNEILEIVGGAEALNG